MDYFEFVRKHNDDPRVVVQTMLEAIRTIMYEQVVRGKISYDDEHDINYSTSSLVYCAFELENQV